MGVGMAVRRRGGEAFEGWWEDGRSWVEVDVGKGLFGEKDGRKGARFGGGIGTDFSTINLSSLIEQRVCIFANIDSR